HTGAGIVVEHRAIRIELIDLPADPCQTNGIAFDNLDCDRIRENPLDDGIPHPLELLHALAYGCEIDRENIGFVWNVRLREHLRLGDALPSENQDFLYLETRRRPKVF